MFTRARRGCVIRDVKIKIPDRNWDQGIWVTSRTGSVSWDLRKSRSWVPASEEEGWLSELGEARRLCALRAPRVGWVESWQCKSSQHRKIVSLSPHVEKPFNSKVIKTFVPEPISWMSCFRIPIYVYEHFMNIMSISRVRILVVYFWIMGMLHTLIQI